MIIYLHMHKCAGTSVIRSAAASGLRLPAMHANANLIDHHGHAIKYRGMARTALAGLLQHQIATGVAFMAMEWDFPRIDMFDDVAPLRFFTSLRDPLARAISNFKMDKVAGWCPLDMPFADYINGDAQYRSDNYYVKLLGQLWPKDTAHAADLDYAMAVLTGFEAVIVVEQGNMNAVLAQFDVTPEPFRFNAFDVDAARSRLHHESQLWISQAEIRDYIDRNALDYTLYRQFTRAIRLPRSTPALSPAPVDACTAETVMAGLR